MFVCVSSKLKCAHPRKQVIIDDKRLVTKKQLYTITISGKI